MTLTKILKRGDASSVVVAILLALILTQPLSTLTSTPAAKLLNLPARQYQGYVETGGNSVNYYAYVIVWALLQIVVLEVICWLYVVVTGSSQKSNKK